MQRVARVRQRQLSAELLVSRRYDLNYDLELQVSILCCFVMTWKLDLDLLGVA